MAKPSKADGKKHVDCRYCQACGGELCAGFTPELARIMASHNAGGRKIKAGDDLFGPDAPSNAIFSLVDGWAFRYILTEDGGRQILDFALPGVVLGLPVAGPAHTFGAQALTDCIACIIPHAVLGPLSQQHPEIGLRLASLISQDRSLAFDHLTSIGRQSARERVAHLLLELFIRCRAQWPGCRTEEMHLPLTQEHIGDATGLTFVHVNRVLRELHQEGIAEFHYRRLRILDPDKLVDVAGTNRDLAAAWLQERPLGDKACIAAQLHLASHGMSAGPGLPSSSWKSRDMPVSGAGRPSR